MYAMDRPKDVRMKRCPTGCPLETAAIRLPRAAQSSSPYKTASRGGGSAGAWDALVTPPCASECSIEWHHSQFQRKNLRLRGEV